jgi:hypothetical protein
MTDTTKFQKLIEALELDESAPGEQDELLTDLNAAIFKSALVRMVESMDEKTREEFATLMENEASEEELEKFLAEKVPGAEQAIEDAVSGIADDILELSDTDVS